MATHTNAALGERRFGLASNKTRESAVWYFTAGLHGLARPQAVRQWEFPRRRACAYPRTLFTISIAALQLSRIWAHFFSAMASREAIQVPPTQAITFSPR